MGAVRGEGCERYLEYSILEMVLRRLRGEGFNASVAYPGQMFPQITETVAAVHIDKVERSELKVTVEITMVTPAALGGTRCEMDALRVTEILRWDGAVCVQNGCTYDGVAQVYMVSILATYIGVTEADSCTIWPSFHCFINGKYHRYAIDFQAEQIRDVHLVYEPEQKDPVGFCPGEEVWKIRLEELVPAGSEEAWLADGEFNIEIGSELMTETYRNCWWTTVYRQRNRQGLRRIRTGYARSREVER